MPNTLHPQQCLEVAIAAAQAGGHHALLNRHRCHEVHQAFRHDVKLQLDLECQARVIEVIRAQFPNHAILGEEDEAAVAGMLAARQPAPTQIPAENIQWVVDPIDGTVNYYHGLPMWCCSVAMQVDGASVAGAVYAPEIDELYTATVDGPALLNGSPIHVSDERELSGAILLTGLSQKEGADYVSPAMVERLGHSVQKIRVLGSAALDMCRVARGHAEAYWEPAIYVWDMAAAGLIVERAGGRVSVLNRQALRVSFMATNGHVHPALRALLPRP